VIADVAQSIREVVRMALAMPLNSVGPEGQTFAGAGTETKHMATVEILDAPDLGQPAYTYANVDGTPTSQVTENVDVLKEITASVNFYRGGNPDAAGLAQWTLRAMDDASRIEQLLKLTSNSQLLSSLGLTFVKASKPRNLKALVGKNWKSRGQIDLTFYVVNRESDNIQSIGSGSVTTKIGSLSGTIEVTT